MVLVHAYIRYHAVIQDTVILLGLEPGEDEEVGIQTVREAVPCTDTIDDNSNNVSPVRRFK